MHRVLQSRWLKGALRIGELPPSAALPLFLCPSLANSSQRLAPRRSPIHSSCEQPIPSRTRQFHSDVLNSQGEPKSATLLDQKPGASSTRKLPTTCSGCGAFTQTTAPDQFGFFNTESKRIKNWLDPVAPKVDIHTTEEANVVAKALEGLDAVQMEALGLSPASLLATETAHGSASAGLDPVCERCHDLVHHGMKATTARIPMHHPTVDSLRETIEESPYKYNHIYHIIDAADFPMSLIPRLHVLLGDIPLRSRNRRSRTGKYMRDRQIEMSFIITRGDLLGPTKEKVDALMPYLREVLRNALGKVGDRVRLGNLRCVSAKRSWWTKPVKEDIWNRGGAGWMIGKVNVGKSQLFEAVYPKGRMIDMEKTREVQMSMYPQDFPSEVEEAAKEDEKWEDLDVGELLPPAQPPRQYPQMPMVSALPGTTASPIRIPFGNGKGELIDLPGLARSDLELFVKPEHRQSLVMKSRIVPEQLSVQPTRSLLLGGGLIRITPRDARVNLLMYNFTPLKEHLTSTEKAIEYQAQNRSSTTVENISLEDVGQKIKHAGTFQLRYDVTKARAGPLTRKDAVGMKVENLPFRVLSVDILIEGVGYVEIVAQVRARDLKFNRRVVPRELSAEREPTGDAFTDMMFARRDVHSPATPVPEPETEPMWPEVDVFTPKGSFVAARPPIQGWLNNKPLVKAKHLKSRPRKAMKGQKKLEKKERRAGTAGDVF